MMMMAMVKPKEPLHEFSAEENDIFKADGR